MSEPYDREDESGRFPRRPPPPSPDEPLAARRTRRLPAERLLQEPLLPEPLPELPEVAPDAVGQAFGLVRDALDVLLGLTTVPPDERGLFDHLPGLPSDVAARLTHVVQRAASLSLDERFHSQEAFDDFVRALPASNEEDVLRELRRLPRDILEGLVWYFANGFASRDAEAQRLEEASGRHRRETQSIARRAIDERARREQLLEVKTARLDELLTRVSAYERERQQAEALLRRLDQSTGAKTPADDEAAPEPEVGNDLPPTDVATLLAEDVHFVYYARSLFWERPPEGVRSAPPLEEGLSNPILVTRRGTEQRHHPVIAMLGARWFRDIATPSQLLYDPRDEALRAANNNVATAMRFMIATGEHVLKVIVPHVRADSRPGAHLIYTLVTRSAERATSVEREPGLLLDAAAELLEGHDFDLNGLALGRPMHHAHPSDLTSDPKLQRAFKQPRTELVRRLEAMHRGLASLQTAMRAQLALLEATKATQRKQATSAFNERRTLAEKAAEVDEERLQLAREQAATDRALLNLDDRDAAIREAARKQLVQELERAREERDAARSELATNRTDDGERAAKLAEMIAAAEVERVRVQEALAERDVALAEAEDIVQDLYRQIELLSRHGGDT